MEILLQIKGQVETVIFKITFTTWYSYKSKRHLDEFTEHYCVVKRYWLNIASTNKFLLRITVASMQGHLAGQASLQFALRR